LWHRNREWFLPGIDEAFRAMMEGMNESSSSSPQAALEM
jgi:hypothetical protein